MSASYSDGWKASGTLIISAPDAAAKARAFAELFWKRLGLDVRRRRTPSWWATPRAGARSPPPVDAPEVLLRLSVRDHDSGKIEAFGKLVPAVILSGPPGVAVTGGRPQAQEVVAYWPALVPRDLVKPRLVTARRRAPARVADAARCRMGSPRRCPRHELAGGQGQLAGMVTRAARRGSRTRAAATRATPPTSA